MVGADARDPVTIARARARFRQEASVAAHGSGTSRREVMWRWVGLILVCGLVALWFLGCSTGWWLR